MVKIESEKLLEKNLKDAVEKTLKGFSFKLLATHITGLPDRICLLPEGRIFFAEIKTTKKTAGKRQILVHKQLKKLGFRVEIIDRTEQIKKLISEYE